ncbi:MAG: EamA family transporter RarD [Proteobacteria bacterium]|nr:EamA family transporter RarD [Pseudomonadota bacterium]
MPGGPDPSVEAGRARQGVVAAAAAYTIWGLFPLYFRALAGVPALEVLAHRIVWTAAVLGVVLTVLKRWPLVVAALRRPRLVAALATSAVVLSLNWLIYVWAVLKGRVLESSLGYFINPLVSVMLGVLVLRESLRPIQALAVVTAAVAVLHQVLALGHAPWIALVLAVSFAVYGLIRKVAQVDVWVGLFFETALMAPLALTYLVAIGLRGGGAFGSPRLGLDVLLLLAGPITAVPLVLFAAGARRVSLSTLGVLQYIAPTGQFLLAILVFHERLAPATLRSFTLIWLALAIYSLGLQRSSRRPPLRAGQAPQGRR